MRILTLAALALLAGCSGKASRQDQLDAAANVSTPAAANVLVGAADNGMNAQAALNQAAQAQEANMATNTSGDGTTNGQ